MGIFLLKANTAQYFKENKKLLCLFRMMQHSIMAATMQIFLYEEYWYLKNTNEIVKKYAALTVLFIIKLIY